MNNKSNKSNILRDLINEEIKKALKESNMMEATQIIHKSASGEVSNVNVDFKQFDQFINSLQPIIGTDINITSKVREDIVNYIVKYLGGYSSVGGGKVTIK